MSTQTKNEAFLEAYDQHADAIFRFCYAQTGNRDAAKDATQETFVRVWKYLAGGKKVDQFRPFLYQTARNILIDVFRKHREQSLDGMREAGWDSVDEHAPDLHTGIEAARAIRLAAALDEPHREVILMRYVDGMMPREIAGIIGTSENVVSVRLHRGLKQLRELMEGIHHD